MKKQGLYFLTGIFLCLRTAAQTIPNGDFKNWEEGCPQQWNCNNDSDCRNKVTKADKINGGVKLQVQHCFDPAKEDRSNNVNIGYDDLSARIQKNKKVKICFDYDYTPVSGDLAYVKIDMDLEERAGPDGNPITAQFDYNGSSDGWLKPGTALHMNCYANFDPKGKKINCPDDVTASSIRTAIGIMPAKGSMDVHKGSTLIINHVRFTIE